METLMHNREVSFNNLKAWSKAEDDVSYIDQIDDYFECISEATDDKRGIHMCRTLLK